MGGTHTHGPETGVSFSSFFFFFSRGGGGGTFKGALQQPFNEKGGLNMTTGMQCFRVPLHEALLFQGQHQPPCPTMTRDRQHPSSTTRFTLRNAKSETLHDEKWNPKTEEPIAAPHKMLAVATKPQRETRREDTLESKMNSKNNQNQHQNILRMRSRYHPLLFCWAPVAYCPRVVRIPSPSFTCTSL